MFYSLNFDHASPLLGELPQRILYVHQQWYTFTVIKDKWHTWHLDAVGAQETDKLCYTFLSQLDKFFSPHTNVICPVSPYLFHTLFSFVHWKIYKWSAAPPLALELISLPNGFATSGKLHYFDSHDSKEPTSSHSCFPCFYTNNGLCWVCL